MTIRYCQIIILIILCNLRTGFSQEANDSAAPKKLSVNGYVKSLQTLAFDESFRNSLSGNFIHNRINLKWKPSENFSAAAEFRNRLFWGEQFRSTPGFAKALNNSQDLADLSAAWINNRNLLLHTNTERLWLEYRTEKWNVRVGRQRINWGMTTLWNPNDIFNTYNFLDFDYEERPGSDAVKTQVHLNSYSHLELAVPSAGKYRGSIGALKYAVNRWSYDFQFIGGWYKKDIILGAGWAGSIKDAGFKGELMYFRSAADSADQFNASLEWDYMFKKGWYLNIGGLYNSGGIHGSIINWSEINFNLSPRNLLPLRFTVATTVSKEITDLLSARMTVLYSPDIHMLLFFPGFTWNIATNLDADLVWISFLAELNHRFGDVSHQGFLRLKWSF